VVIPRLFRVFTQKTTFLDFTCPNSDVRFPIVKPSFLRYNIFVRLDLFLKVCRLVKRRAVARELCEAGRVSVNGHQSKPAKEVNQGDRITLKFTSRIIELEVLELVAASPNKTDAMLLYRVITEKRIEHEVNA
jgi:ribosomal 50S subunit-recycling heat shock protein